jgi:hypothetical protein
MRSVAADALPKKDERGHCLKLAGASSEAARANCGVIGWASPSPMHPKLIVLRAS